jgi:integral membrane protein
MMLSEFIKKYEQFTPFTENEAWGLYRIAAFAEAVGWSLLIIGILLGKYVFVGSAMPVQLAGRIHGTLFLLYIAAAILLYPSQGWSRKRTIIAAVVSVPPYGSLIFEQWAAYHRNRTRISRSIFLSAYLRLTA